MRNNKSHLRNPEKNFEIIKHMLKLCVVDRLFWLMQEQKMCGRCDIVSASSSTPFGGSGNKSHFWDTGWEIIQINRVKWQTFEDINSFLLSPHLLHRRNDVSVKTFERVRATIYHRRWSKAWAFRVFTGMERSRREQIKSDCRTIPIFYSRQRRCQECTNSKQVKAQLIPQCVLL